MIDISEEIEISIEHKVQMWKLINLVFVSVVPAHSRTWTTLQVVLEHFNFIRPWNRICCSSTWTTLQVVLEHFNFTRLWNRICCSSTWPTLQVVLEHTSTWTLPGNESSTRKPASIPSITYRFSFIFQLTPVIVLPERTRARLLHPQLQLRNAKVRMAPLVIY